MAKKGLGKGLNSLFNEEDIAVSDGSLNIFSIFV